MNWLSFLVTSVLLTVSLCFDAQPRKQNMISNYLKKFLDPLLEDLSKTNLSVPHINLGKDVGTFSNLNASISGGLTKEIDGHGAWGFSLKMEMKNIQIRSRYDIKHLDLPKLFPIFGKGDLEVAIERINLNMVFAAQYNAANENFNITLPTFILSAGTSKVHFESLMDNPAVTEFLNELISALVPDLVTTVNEPLKQVATKYSDLYGNGILNCFRTQLLQVQKCIEDFLKDPNQDKLPMTVADKVAAAVLNNFLKSNSTK